MSAELAVAAPAGCGALDSSSPPAVAKGMPLRFQTGPATRLLFPNATFAQVYFEAVANAFDAGATTIDIVITVRRARELEITIRDNGDGFTNERFGRFAEVMEPKDEHHKGVGRIVYLKYFSGVEVTSVFTEKRLKKRRHFFFSDSFDGEAPTESVEVAECGTTLRFYGHLQKKLPPSDDLKPGTLKDRLIEHFLPVLEVKKRAGVHFRIGVKFEWHSEKVHKELVDNEVLITTADVPELELRTFRDPTVHALDDIHMRFALIPEKSWRLTAASIDGRAFPLPLLRPSALPPHYTAIFLFEAAFFNGKSDSARQRLMLSQDVQQADVERACRRQIASVLRERLPELEERNSVTRQSLEARYPHLYGLFDEETVGLIDGDEAIESAQRLFFRKQREVLDGDALDDATFKKSLEVSARTLTEYILYREFIIKKLDDISAKNTEEDLHNLIVPRRRRFDGAALADGVYSNNAWLLDDKFMSFQTILSEVEMEKLIAVIAPGEIVSDDTRPDISMVFSGHPESGVGVDVVVIEVKRRTLNAKENTFAGTQLVQRAIALSNYYHAIQRIWYFAVIEIDDSLGRLLKSSGYTPLFSRGRHVYYQEFPVEHADGYTIPTPVCLLSFDAVIKDAAARNHTFLEILKNAFKKARERSGG